MSSVRAKGASDSSPGRRSSGESSTRPARSTTKAKKLWVCNLDYDAARGLCRFSRRRLLAGASRSVRRGSASLRPDHAHHREAHGGEVQRHGGIGTSRRYDLDPAPSGWASVTCRPAMRRAGRSKRWSNGWKQPEFRGSASAGCNPIRGSTARYRTTVRSSPRSSGTAGRGLRPNMPAMPA